MKGSEDSSTATCRPRSAASSPTRTPDRFQLSGPSLRLDPRVHAYRADVADVGLAGKLFAPHYARPQLCAVEETSVAMYAAPDRGARAVSQLVLGEAFETLDISGGWAWGRSVHDRYVGYVPADSLGSPHAATHRVAVASALIFKEPDIKAPVIGSLPIGARGETVAEGDFLHTAIGYIHHRHAVAIGARIADHVSVAERLIGLPYLWGGRGAGGIDCSGLVQVALDLAGVTVPRDSDLQRDSVGRLLDESEPAARGDLVFFPGHVGLMVDGERLIHANAHWMAVVVEPLADVVGRLISSYPQPVLARRRLEMPE